MKRSIGYWQLAGYVFTCVFGTLLHFVYDWTNGNIFASLFSAINESIWEHMKLLYFPMLVFAIFESKFFSKEYPSFWCSKLIGFILGLVSIPVIYYSYTGMFGKNIDWINILIFFIAAFVSFYTEYKLVKNERKCVLPLWLSIAIIFFIGILFIVFTLKTPQIPIFQDPISKTYGRIV